MSAALLSDTLPSTPLRWSAYAGLFLFVWGAAAALVLDRVLVLLAEVFRIPAAGSVLVFPAPALVVGPAVWWATVERRHAYSYHVGVAAGFLTALVTGLVWTVGFGAVFGAEFLTVRGVVLVVTVVLGVVCVAGAVAGLPLMYARRRAATGGVTTAGA